MLFQPVIFPRPLLESNSIVFVTLPITDMYILWLLSLQYITCKNNHCNKHKIIDTHTNGKKMSNGQYI